MTEKPGGGPAFPHDPYRGPTGGITVRDWFAGHILQGCLAYSHHNESWGDFHNNGTDEQLAQHVYKIADAMLAERDKT